MLRLNTTGGNNTASGATALSRNTTGSDNTASGRAALANNQTGSSNTASGALALQDNTSGFFNTASGYEALHSNTLKRSTPTPTVPTTPPPAAMFSVSTRSATTTPAQVDKRYIRTSPAPQQHVHWLERARVKHEW